MIIKVIISAILYLVLAPVAGCLLTGYGRRAAAKMQGRKGPAVKQPFYDVKKLMEKKNEEGPYIHDYYVKVFLFFIIAAGTAFFAGADIVFVILTVAVADIFLVTAAYTSNSPYAQISAEYEFIRILSYLPMIFFMAIGFYLYCGSLNVRDIVISTSMPFLPLIGIFAGVVFIFALRSRRTPFDLNSSGDTVGNKIMGMTSEFSGKTLALVEIAHWYEQILMLGFIFLFFGNGTSWGYLIGAVVCVIVYFLEIFIDNCFASMKWKMVLKITWTAALVLGAINVFMLYVII